MKNTNYLFLITALMLFGCKSKVNEVCDCFKKAANTYMVKGEKASESDLTKMCSQFEGSLKESGIEDKRKFQECLDTVKEHIKNKSLFTDIEDVKLSKLPCAEELIKALKEKRTEDEKNYYLKGREIECEIAIHKISKTDGEFRVTGYFFDDKNVFDYGLNSFEVYVILSKDETENILEAIKKEEAYPDLKNNSNDNFKMLFNGPLAFKQILKFKGTNVHRNTNYGLTFNFIEATDYEFIKPDPKIHKQQHFGYNDFIFDGKTNTPTASVTASTPKEQAVKPSITITPPTGQWNGDFGKDKLTINIESVNGTEVTGWDEVKGNRRNLKGTVETQNDKFNYILKEPGDDKWDGVFEFTIVNGENIARGNWKSNNGKSTKNFELKK